MDPAQKLELEAMELVKPIESASELGDSDIQLFYRGAVVFLTGGTGFIGKQLLEKLFRSCEIKKAFVLVRPKKGRKIKERLQDMLNDPVFELVRKKKPELESRIVAVEGDVASLQLGISNYDWNVIEEEVDVIFHVAATVRFNEDIRTAAITNVRGTREVLALGKACKKLRSFVHVSTAYCHTTCDRVGNEVREQFYRSPLPADTLLTMVDTVSQERLDAMTQSLISGWPNTYSFTKAVAEELVQAESGNLPVCIVRPSIVINSYREPVPGWVDMSCVYGPTGLILATGMGVVRVLYVNNELKLALVPVDYVNNATIAAGWQTGLRGLQKPLIYHISTTGCGVTFKHLSAPIKNTGRNLATPVSLWYAFAFQVKYRSVFDLLSWLLHFIPAYTIDAVMNVFKIKKPRELKSFMHIYEKYNKLSQVFAYFLINEWNFDDTNLQSLWHRMSTTDRTIFNFDMDSIDWVHHAMMWCLGVRKYIIKDGLKDTEKAITKQKWLKIANYGVIIVYLATFWLILSCFWWIVRIVF